MSQYPYDQQPQPTYPQQYLQDQPPQYGYPQQQYPAPPQPVYYAQPAPAPVQVNVTQNNGYPLVARKKVNHALHVTLTIFTSGLWLFVYIPIVRRARRPVAVAYYR